MASPENLVLHQDNTPWLIIIFILLNTPYSKMAAILVLCLIANCPFWPRSRLNIPLNFIIESEAKRANLQVNKRILKQRPFWNKVYTCLPDSVLKYIMINRANQRVKAIACERGTL